MFIGATTHELFLSSTTPTKATGEGAGSLCCCRRQCCCVYICCVSRNHVKHNNILYQLLLCIAIHDIYEHRLSRIVYSHHFWPLPLPPPSSSSIHHPFNVQSSTCGGPPFYLRTGADCWYTIYTIYNIYDMYWINIHNARAHSPKIVVRR